MERFIVECTYDDECTFIETSYIPQLALSAFDDHLQDKHGTDFETEVERLEAEEERDIEDIVAEQVEAQTA